MWSWRNEVVNERADESPQRAAGQRTTAALPGASSAELLCGPPQIGGSAAPCRSHQILPRSLSGARYKATWRPTSRTWSAGSSKGSTDAVAFLQRLPKRGEEGYKKLINDEHGQGRHRHGGVTLLRGTKGVVTCQIPRLLLWLVLSFVGSASFMAQAAQLCTDLPQSRLQTYDVRRNGVEEITVSRADLDRGARANSLISRHNMMLSGSSIMGWFDIAHRPVKQTNGMVCDAPFFVRIGFGVKERVALLVRSAAENACVRQQLLTHEAAHNRAINATIDRFIDVHTSEFVEGVIALKKIPAPDEATAKRRWEAGLKLMVNDARSQLETELKDAVAKVDTPAALKALEDACSGRIRSLEKSEG